MSDGTTAIRDPAGPAAQDGPVSSRQQILHDLRNCLYVIRNGLEVLQADGSTTETAAAVISIMQAEEKKANQLLLNYERLTADAGA